MLSVLRGRHEKQSVKISKSLRPKGLVSIKLGQICPNTPTVIHICISPAFKVQSWSYSWPAGSHKCTEGIDSDLYNQDINKQVIQADGLQTERQEWNKLDFPAVFFLSFICLSYFLLIEIIPFHLRLNTTSLKKGNEHEEVMMTVQSHIIGG